MRWAFDDSVRHITSFSEPGTAVREVPAVAAAVMKESLSAAAPSSAHTAVCVDNFKHYLTTRKTSNTKEHIAK